MKIQSITAAACAVIAIATLAGCAPTPPRPSYSNAPPGYVLPNRDDCPSRCGVIQDINQVYVRDNSTSGNGAVLGAVIGAIFGSAIGRGGGRTAATLGGAVVGGFAGNAIESNSNPYMGPPAWQFSVRLDDGRWATVTQWDPDGLRPGDRVLIRDDRLFRY